jgi:hypothetical protein
MKIHFKYNSQHYNFPDNQKHIDIQSNLKKKIETLLEPIEVQLENEPTGHLDVNYDDEHIDNPSIEVHGFSGDSTVKILTFLNTMAE